MSADPYIPIDSPEDAPFLNAGQLQAFITLAATTLQDHPMIHAQLVAAGEAMEEVDEKDDDAQALANYQALAFTAMALHAALLETRSLANRLANPSSAPSSQN